MQVDYLIKVVSKLSWLAWSAKRLKVKVAGLLLAISYENILANKLHT